MELNNSGTVFNMQWWSMLGIAAFVLGFIHQNTFALVEFTNIKCVADDPSHVTIEYCYLKSVNRSYKYLSVYAAIPERNPVNNVTVRFKIWKRANGYKPFLYDITFDGCKFMKNPKMNNVVEYIFNFFNKYSNMNHSCPYSNYVAVEKLPVSHINNMVTNVLPVPDGQYMFESRWMAYNKLWATIKLYVNIN